MGRSTLRRNIWNVFAPEVSGQNGHWRYGNLRWASKHSSVSSNASPCVEYMSACSPSWRWKANPSIRGSKELNSNHKTHALPNPFSFRVRNPIYRLAAGEVPAPSDPVGCAAEGCLGQFLLAATSGGNAASRPEKGASCESGFLPDALVCTCIGNSRF